ncbi:MAG: peptidylprolyl isomerase [Chloroherpetonaceae bacterium]|nr:peptidylprolyl isomerase [Chthonomonadaceae bacterium]MDW8207043.1 peptidylprolyl isomerase [Chloroherpetonaceae bacterium]
MRPVLALVALIAVGIGVAALTSRFHDGNPPLYETNQADMPEPEKKNTSISPAEREKAFDQVKEGAIRATLEIEGKGVMTLELYPKAAPETVKHVVELARKGFYNGILFHRVVPDFVAQAGDPVSKKYKPEDFRWMTPEEVGARYQVGMGGSGKTVPLEAKLPHLPNTIGLARADAPDTGDSQFYINLKDNASLDNQYCVFGRVIAGTDIPAKIAMGDRIKRFTVP